jgi:tryptophanyl-tRNA synthetase
MKELIFSGVQPSAAQVHIGNYLGAMKNFVSLQDSYPLMVCIVDLHALTSVEKREDLASFTMSLAAAYLAIGLTKESTILFRQSDIPEVCELSWYFACHFPLGLLERAHAFKDKKAKKSTSKCGFNVLSDSYGC